MPSSEFASLPLPDQRAIDQICLEFEDRWLERPQPELSTLVTRAPDSLRAPLLAELVKIDATYRRRRGESIAPEHYVTQFPDAAEIIHGAFGRPEPAAGDMTLAPDVVVGRYRVVKRLGAGSWGEVFLARDESLGRDVALKTLRREGDEEWLLEEARTAARLRHPGIAAVFDTGRLPDDRPFVVMEYVEGSSLRQRLQREPLAFSPADAAALIAEVSEAVDAAHRQGVIHRDLCPENILLDTAGRPTVTDFGLALHELQRADRADEVAGSPAYMAPEQVRGETAHLDGRADVWALGVMLYELIAGRRPFGGETREQLAAAILQSEPPPLRREGARVTGPVERACLGCLEKEVGRRCRSAADLAAALRPAPKRPVARLAAVLLVAAAVWYAMAAGATTKPPSAPPRLTLWIHDQGVMTPLSDSRPQLREGDEVFLSCSAARPMFFHVWWLDSTGEARRLTEARQASRRRRQRLPSDLELAWPLPPQPGGLDTVLVVASDSPVAPDFPADAARTAPSLKLARPAWFADGRRTAASRAGPDGKVSRIHDPLGAWHQRIAEHFRTIGATRAVTFSCHRSPSFDKPASQEAEPTQKPAA